MRLSLRLPFLLVAVAASSTCYAATRKLLVGSGSGQLTTLIFDTAAGTLSQSSANTLSAPNPTWQTLFKSPTGKKFILSVSEAYDGVNDAITVLEVASNGALTRVSKSALSSVVTGPVSIAATKDGLIVSASYSGGGVNSFSMNPYTGLLASRPINTFRYTLTSPGADPSRQEAPHPHQALIDPTGKFVLVPDLGADLIRLYSVISASQGISELTPVRSAPGAGPRHGAFSPAGKHYYQVNELSNSVDVFTVAYNPTITFTPVQNISVYPSGTVPALSPVPTAGEIAISTDGKYLYTSNRSDKTFPNARVAPYPSTQTTQSDSLSTFSIAADGKLTFIEQTPVAGITPRHFSLEPTYGGEYVAVATQTTGRIAVYTRNKYTGKLGTVPVASITLTMGAAQPACVTWLD